MLISQHFECHADLALKGDVVTVPRRCCGGIVHASGTPQHHDMTWCWSLNAVRVQASPDDRESVMLHAPPAPFEEQALS